MLNLSLNLSNSIKNNSIKDTFSLAIHNVRVPSLTYNLNVRWFDKISDVKIFLRNLTNEQLSRHHLYLPQGTKELSNTLMLHDVGIVKSGAKLRVIIDSSIEDKNTLAPFNESIQLSNELLELIDDSRSGLSSNQPPAKTDEFQGSGGVYFIRKRKGGKVAKVAVFKPLDEEPGMPNNPKGRATDTLRDFFSPGEGGFREIAAYIFDVDNFCSVPPTALVM